MNDFFKYPRTTHLRDADPITGKHIVVEEKMDGTQVGISFDLNGSVLLQTRGHIIGQERQFDLLKSWVNVHYNTLFELLGTHYIMFGEWLLMKHTVYYDMLPHFFMEYDVLDKKTEKFLTTIDRNQMFTDTPVTSVAVLWSGMVESEDDVDEIKNLIGKSLFKSSEWKNNLAYEADLSKSDLNEVLANTDESNLMEGLYIKAEDSKVSDRIKLIRPDFIRLIENSEHWKDQKPIYNRLRPGVNLWRV